MRTDEFRDNNKSDRGRIKTHSHIYELIRRKKRKENNINLHRMTSGGSSIGVFSLIIISYFRRPGEKKMVTETRVKFRTMYEQ